jgi:hypothetical protein
MFAAGVSSLYAHILVYPPAEDQLQWDSLMQQRGV